MVIFMAGVVLRELMAKAGTGDESVFDFFSRRAGDEVYVSVMILYTMSNSVSLKVQSNEVFAFRQKSSRKILYSPNSR